MDSFDELSLAPELVEALAAEGIERPNALQQAAIPVLARGNNLVAVAGPGAGILVAVGAPLLDRVDPEAGTPGVLIVSAARDRAQDVAASLSRPAHALGHRVASAHGAWALPERATVLTGTPHDLLEALREGRFGFDGVQAFVVEGASAIEALGQLEAVESLLEAVPSEAQKVVVALPLTDGISDFVERQVKRAVHVPPRAAGQRESAPARGTLSTVEVRGDREESVADLCAALLDADTHHVALFVRNEDDAADLGDALVLRGFAGGPPGSPNVPVWLVVDDLEGRNAMDEAEGSVVPVSVHPPFEPDSLDRRHGAGRGGYVLVAPREVAHVRDLARRTGYTLERRPPAETPVGGSLAEMLEALENALRDDEVDVDAYGLVLEPLVARFGATRVAGAALGLLRSRGLPARAAPAAPAAAGAAPASPPGDMVKLYISLGQKDGIGPGDLVGAITGESGIDGKKIGRIDLRETFSLVEVERALADRVIRGLNGVTVKGRSVRVDLDRSERSGGRPPRGPGRPGGAGRAPRRGGPGRG